MAHMPGHPTGSRLTSSIHISPTSASPTIRKSRASVVASASVRKIRSTLVQRPTVLRHCFEAAVGEEPPGGGGILVLGDPGAALALGAGGDQVPEPEPHLGAIADGPIGKAVILVAGDVGFEVQAVGARDVMPRVAAVFGRLGPGGLGLREVLLAVQRHDGRGSSPRPAAARPSRIARSGIVVAVEEVLVLKPEPDMHEPPGAMLNGSPAVGPAGRSRSVPPRPRRPAYLRFGPTAGGRARAARTLVLAPDRDDQLLAAPVRLVGRRDHLADDRKIRAVGNPQRRPPRHRMARHPRVRHPAVNLHPDLLGRDDHPALAREPKPIVDDPGPLILRHGAPTGTSVTFDRGGAAPIAAPAAKIIAPIAPRPRPRLAPMPRLSRSPAARTHLPVQALKEFIAMPILPWT